MKNWMTNHGTLVKIIVLLIAMVITTGASVIIAKNTIIGEQGPMGEQGIQGIPGVTGAVGENGSDGKSAYELAVENGYKGTLEEWLVSLIGEAGTNGLNGSDGINGQSAYELAVDKGYQGTESQWLASLIGSKGDKGDKGDTGNSGANGKSAYELAVENGFEGTLSQWLDSLVGDKGNKGDKGDKGNKGDKGDVGATGKSAYDLAVENGYEGTLTQWLASLVGSQGEKGDTGETGKTAYDLAIENGYEGTLTEWLLTLVGAKGDKGDVGETGETGKSAYDAYCEKYGYVGTEEQWIEEFINGTLNKYTVTFDLNGGVAGANFMASVGAPHGKPIALSTPTRDGYTFLGWFTGDGVNDGQFTTTDIVTSDMTLKARWRVNTFEVIFLDYYKNMVSTQTVNYGTDATAPNVDAVIGAVRFDSWSADFTNVRTNMTIEARYVANIYTINYNTSGLLNLNSNAYYMGTVPSEPQNVSAAGYVFDGWYLDSAYTESYVFDYALDADKTLYAKFLRDGEYTVISTYEGLLSIASNPSGKYVLANDIDCRGELWTAVDTFSGVLDGAGHKIYNFNISDTSATVGFVRQNTGIIQNVSFGELFVNIVRAESSGDKAYGVISGINYGTITNCHILNGTIDTHIESKQDGVTLHIGIGGISGKNQGTIMNSSNSADINVYGSADNRNTNTYGDSYSTYYHIGGVTGYNEESGTVICCMNNSSISMNSYAKSPSWYECATRTRSCVGGIVGTNNGSINESTSYTHIGHTGTHHKNYAYTYMYNGGAVGVNMGTIANSYATGSIVQTGAPSETYVGGFVAVNNGVINTCYSTVDVSDESGVVNAVAGFVGHNELISGYNATINKCFSTGSVSLVSRPSNYGYFVGQTSGSELHTYYLDTVKISVEFQNITPNNSVGTSKKSNELYSKTFLKNTLYLSDDIWSITEGEAPTLKSLD